MPRQTKASLLEENYRLQRENENLRLLSNQWKAKAEARVDLAMMDARIKLASQLGQMIEATSRAVGFIIGKEVL